ncbi:flagellar basal body P-ring formation chaperone FlgA [Pseudothauera rhizosphaerae]|uniref:Flagella basal body P-ring formation protein FlgA n=1 Tax=Pseudothauera rhizosphaerae TaxID=2565932 RepID=A0A4V3WBQ5_9RHOO|nr:flagellar basal body P-ring formation chaperone FlgA [Pseudothauera rhizosphaerae]THF64186.1 flagellar basal body P-ring formation protein FlgA [Pseudothauera rhizosphaerae]
MSVRFSVRGGAARLLCGLALAVSFASAAAQQAAEPVRATALRFLQAEAAGLPGEVKVSVGELDPNNRLPPCAELAAFFPAGARAWGQTNVGVRCDSPVTWTAYLPARVEVVADYLVVARALRPGQIVGSDDLRLEQGDLAALPANTLTDPTQAVGHHARIAVAAGAALRASHLRLPPAVRQGQDVRVVSGGPGFSVTSEGRALNAAAEGESVRVRLPGGQVVSGIARNGGVVEVPQ